MIYGAKLRDATQGLRIDDPVYATNLNENFKQCVLYDILLGLKTYDDTLKSSDLLTAMGPGSVALSQQYIYPDGTSGIVTCETAYNVIHNGWINYYAIAAPTTAPQFLTCIPVAQPSTRLPHELRTLNAAVMGPTIEH